LSTILAVAAGNEMVVSRNSPVAELNWFCFLLIWIYLNSEEFDCKGRRGRPRGALFEELFLPGDLNA